MREQGLALERLLGMPLEDRPNALVLDPIRYGPLAFMTRSAHDQFLPVVLIDEPVGINPGLVWTFVSSDEAAVGRRAATELVRLLGGRRGATLLVTSHESAAERATGFRSAIRARTRHPEPVQLTVTGRSAETVEATVTAFLGSHPELVGIYAADAPAGVATGRVNATRSPRLPVVATDADPEELRLLRSGALQVLVVRPGFRVGEVAVDAAVGAALSGRQTPVQMLPPFVLAPESFEGLEPGALPAGVDLVPSCRP